MRGPQFQSCSGTLVTMDKSVRCLGWLFQGGRARVLGMTPWGEEVRYQNIQLYLFSSDVCCVLQSTLDFTKQYIGMIQDIWDHFY